MNTEFAANEPFDRLFLLKSLEERLTKNGKPYLALVLGTPMADFEARLWDMEMKSLPGLSEGDPVRAKGTSQLYQEKIQLIIDAIEKVGTPVNPREIYPSSLRPEKELREEFHNFIRGITDRHLAALLDAMKKDNGVLDAFFISPAAVFMHHARIGGLAEHTLDVCRIALAVSDIRPELDRDLLTAGAILHDIGKIREYQVAGDFRHSQDGKFIGHISLGYSIVENWIRSLPLFPERLARELLHIILSHHGSLESGSPKAPAIAEALVIHYADNLDAKLDMVHTAHPDDGAPEAYVRGLRQMFQYRTEDRDAGRRARENGHADAETHRRGEEQKKDQSTAEAAMVDKGDGRKKSDAEGKVQSHNAADGIMKDDDQGKLF